MMADVVFTNTHFSTASLPLPPHPRLALLSRFESFGVTGEERCLLDITALQGLHQLQADGM